MIPKPKFDDSDFVTKAMNLELNRTNFGNASAVIHEKIAIASRAWALFLDLDGILPDIAERPEDVVVPSGLVADLDRIRAGLSGALAIVGGRSLADIDRLLHPQRFGAAAEHGSRIRLAESEQLVSSAIAFDPSIASAIELAVGGFGGVAVERKKAHAVETPMSSSAFRGREPVFIGDDACDEEACVFVEKTGGVALPVAGEYFGPERAALQSPGDIRRWISKLARDLERSPGAGRR